MIVVDLEASGIDWNRCGILEIGTKETFFQEYRINNEDMILDNPKSRKMSEFCGLKDNSETHNALTDAELEAECFSRLAFGKNLLKEYSEFPVPQHLIKNNSDEI